MALINKSNKRQPPAPPPEEVLPLLKGITNILALNRVSAMHFERLVKELNLKDDKEAIVFLTGVKAILRKLPEKMFTDIHTRNAILDAVQDALDSAIDREEAAEDLDNQDETP